MASGNISSIDAILFDLDGTLVNSLGDIAGCVNRVRKLFGLSGLLESQVVLYVGHGVESLVEGCFAEILPDVKKEELVSVYHREYGLKPHYSGFTYPTVNETLKELQERGVRLAVATNKPTAAAELVLAHYLPEIHFDPIFGPEKVSRRKPDPAHLLEVVSAMGCDKERVCFVGDSTIDLDCAAAAGIPFYAAAYGFGGLTGSDEIRLERFSDLWQRVPSLREFKR